MSFSKTFNLKNEKGIFLAYDHGIEHGVKDFINNRAHNPQHILDLTYKSQINGVVLTPGVIEKYIKEIKDYELNTILKINSKSLLAEDQYFSGVTASIDFALKYDVKAIGYTIYFGSIREHEMIETFCMLKEEAKDHGIYTVLWAYPRGKNIKDDKDKNTISYAARIGMELGSDALKLKIPHQIKDIEEITKHVHRTYVFFAGGEKENKEETFLKTAKEVIKRSNGMIVGRNIWQRENALDMLNKIKEFI